MGNKTTVQIDKKTLPRLKAIKLTKRESHDEIINRLLDEHEKLRQKLGATKDAG